MAYNKDIVLYQGSDFFMDVTIQDANGYEIDLTGYTASGQVREGYADDSSIQAEFTTSISASTGTVSVSLSASQTRNISFQFGRYDIEVTDSAGVVTRIIEGRVRLSKEVTRVS